ETSFGAFQMRRRGGDGWQWDRAHLEQALDGLPHHGFVEAVDGGLFRLTALGRLAGESAVEVETLMRVSICLRDLGHAPSDPELIAIAQMSVELDEVWFPVNRKSTQKEPQHWVGQLRRQGVSPVILA